MPNLSTPVEVLVNPKLGKVPHYLVGKGKAQTKITSDELPDPDETREFLVNSPQKVQERKEKEMIPVRVEKEGDIVLNGETIRISNKAMLKGFLKTELIEIASVLGLTTTDGTKDFLVSIIAKKIGV